MKVKKIPLRTCVVTREKYIKKDVTVLEQAKKKKILERHLECIIEESVYEDIEEKLKK